ncbi:MAG: hypothetical protein ACPGED_02620 [Flavobacteriales bacterium]
MKRKNWIVGMVLCVLITSIATLSSCKKDEDTIATVQVFNEFGNPVPGATVRLKGEATTETDFVPESRFDTTGVTNGNGKVSFNFSDFYKKGQAGFVVLDIVATKGSLEGTGIIKIEEEETNEEGVSIE